VIAFKLSPKLVGLLDETSRKAAVVVPGFRIACEAAEQRAGFRPGFKVGNLRGEIRHIPASRYCACSYKSEDRRRFTAETDEPTKVARRDLKIMPAALRAELSFGMSRLPADPVDGDLAETMWFLSNGPGVLE